MLGNFRLHLAKFWFVSMLNVGIHKVVFNFKTNCLVMFWTLLKEICRLPSWLSFIAHFFSSYLFPYVAYILVYDVAPYLLRMPLRNRRDPSKKREYIDRRGENLEATSFSQETVILEDVDK